MAELSTADQPDGPADRPFPPGDYPIVVVGSGPGALQLSYSLSRLGVTHAVLSADPAPGGMFRRWPFFQRLLSWTKPYARPSRDSPAYERYDWNSLLADEPEARAIMPRLMDGSSPFPSRPEMEANLVAFADRTGIRVRYGCRWEATRRLDGPGPERFVLETSDGEYRCRAAVFAVGISEPWRPATPGLEFAAHYADTRPAESYAGRRIFILGKQNSGFELATGLLPWACRIVLASPSPAKLSVNTRSLVGVRARYVQPYEDHILGGGVSVIDAAVGAIDRVGDAFVVHTRRTDGGADLVIEVDELIAATGFVAPLRDLPALGVATYGQARLPAQTPFWESATVPGIHFAGTITQGAAGLKKHGIPSNSGAVHGARYNARVLALELARRHAGIEPERPTVAPNELVSFLLSEAAMGPDIWHQRAYLARVVSVTPEEGLRDEGILPLARVLDDVGGPDAIVMTLESDATGAIYPVAYLRSGDRIEEHVLDGHPLLEFDTPAHRAQLLSILRGSTLLADVGDLGGD